MPNRLPIVFAVHAGTIAPSAGAGKRRAAPLVDRQGDPRVAFGSSRLGPPCDRGLIAGQGRGGVLAIRDGRITAQRTEAYDCRAADGNEYQLTVRLVASR